MRGSVRRHKRDKGFVYEAVYDVGPDPATGRRRQRSRTFATRREADAFLRKRIGEIERGEYGESGDMTVATLMERWLAEEAAHRVRPSTLRMYKRGAAVVVSGLGAVRLSRLTASRVQAFYASLVADSVGVSTVELAHTVLNMALKMAARLGLVGSIATERARPPRLKAGERGIWSVGQMRAFVEEARSGRYYVAHVLALACGLRIGEVLGLCWSDVDLEARVLRVRRSYSPGTGRHVLSETKTGRSRRVGLSDFVVSLLRWHRDGQEAARLAAGTMWRDEDAVIAGELGGRVGSGVVRRDLARVVERAGLPQVHFHDLRHMQASLLLAGGVSVPEVSQRLGHARSSMTLDVYGHRVGPDVAASVVESALFSEPV